MLMHWLTRSLHASTPPSKLPPYDHALEPSNLVNHMHAHVAMYKTSPTSDQACMLRYSSTGSFNNFCDYQEEEEEEDERFYPDNLNLNGSEATSSHYELASAVAYYDFRARHLRDKFLLCPNFVS